MSDGGAALREARLAARMTLRELAARVRAMGVPCSHSYIHVIESGGQEVPREDVLLAIADVLGRTRSEMQAMFRILSSESLEAQQPELYRIQRLLAGMEPSRRRRVVAAIEELVGAPAGA